MRAHSAPPACGPWTSRPVAQSTRRRSSSGSSRSPDMRTTPSSESDRGARRRWHTNEREHVEPGGIEGLPARHDLRGARRTAPGLNSWSDGPTEAGHAGAGEDIGSDLRAVAPLTRSDTLGVEGDHTRGGGARCRGHGELVAVGRQRSDAVEVRGAAAIAEPVLSADGRVSDERAAQVTALRSAGCAAVRTPPDTRQSRTGVRLPGEADAHT